jgi:hypothetical protein
MAIYSSVPPPPQAPATPSQPGIDIEAWTLHALQHLSLSTTSSPIPLHIPISDAPARPPLSRPVKKASPRPAPAAQSKRRELAAKGKEGSRRRQRWENDRLLGVPGVQPPLPSDWEVQSTSPVRRVPYYLAPLWEELREREGERQGTKKEVLERGRVPQELRMRMKKAKAAREMLRGLEEEVRGFVEEWEEVRRREMEEEEEAQGRGEVESSDEEIVFVGRDLSSRTLRLREEETKERQLAATRERERRRERCVYEARLEDSGAAFARYLVHALATYYGLSSRSVTVGEKEKRRAAFVAIKAPAMKIELPRPLYGLV